MYEQTFFITQQLKKAKLKCKEQPNFGKPYFVNFHFMHIH